MLKQISILISKMNTEQSQEDYRKQYLKEYQKNHTEQTKAAKAKWRNKNREHTRDYAKEYYAKNKTKYAEMYEETKEDKVQKAKDYHKTPHGKKLHMISYWKRRKIVHDDFEKLHQDFTDARTCSSCGCEYGERGDGSGMYKCIATIFNSNDFGCICCYRCMNRAKVIAKNELFKSALNTNEDI
jgi:hypothetical protein